MSVCVCVCVCVRERVREERKLCEYKKKKHYSEYGGDFLQSYKTCVLAICARQCVFVRAHVPRHEAVATAVTDANACLFDQQGL